MDAAGPSLKIIANYAVGFDNIEIRRQQTGDCCCQYIKSKVDESVAEYTWALILCSARRIVETMSNP